MWKPFLARSLRSVFGGRRHAIPPCGADRIFSRAYTGQEPEAGGGREGTSRPPPRHLYVVLYAYETSGHRFHKLNLDDALEDMNDGGVSEGNGMDGAQNLRRLPEPILRIGSHRIGTRAHIHALLSNLVITGAAYGRKGLTLVYDTDTAELDIAEDLPDELNSWYFDAVAAGDRLHALQVPRYFWDAPPPPESMECQEQWTWACADRSPIPTHVGATGYGMRAHALHPDGGTIFVSVDYLGCQEGQDTFSLDTESGDWTHRGNWRLPFDGLGHYDGDLEAWVGVVSGTAGCKYLCSCDVPDLAHGSTPPPAWKLGEEKLTFLEEPLMDGGHAPMLVHTGHGRFCLAESALLKAADTDDDTTTFSYILRATMFRPKYGKNGELVVAAAPRSGRSYEIPSDTTSLLGPAFWI
ncbi:unnamed protein product [Alopecurus aequalis]